MSSPLIEGLRSVAFDVPDLALAETFYTEVWHLDVVDRTATLRSPSMRGELMLKSLFSSSVPAS